MRICSMHKEMFKPMRLYDVAFGEEPQSLARLIRRGRVGARGGCRSSFDFAYNDAD